METTYVCLSVCLSVFICLRVCHSVRISVQHSIHPFVCFIFPGGFESISVKPCSCVLYILTSIWMQHTPLMEIYNTCGLTLFYFWYEIVQDL